jgi:hypothetical protein
MVFNGRTIISSTYEIFVSVFFALISPKAGTIYNRYQFNLLISGLKFPGQHETLSMLSNDSLGFDDDHQLLPVVSETTKHDLEKTDCSNLRPFLTTFPDDQLLAKRKVFQSQVGILLEP